MPSRGPHSPYGAPDYGWGHAGFPAISLTRQAAEAFCAWLSSKTGKPYRLPTEAEWARAAALAIGAQPLAAARRDALAWHRGNSSARTHAVGTKTSDALGLFDLFGNAGEWVLPAGGALVLRGGSFRDAAESIGTVVASRSGRDVERTRPATPEEPVVALGRAVCRLPIGEGRPRTPDLWKTNRPRRSS